MQPRILLLHCLFIIVLFMPGPLRAATITVNSLADTALDEGSCTLREAITAANNNSASGPTVGECAAGSGGDVIEFSISGTLQPGGQLPIITSVIHIDGYTAPGASRNSQPMAAGTNAVLTIEIDGVNANDVPTFTLSGNGASGSIIEGLVINNSANSTCCGQSGFYVQNVQGAATTIIRGNFIGTDITGSARRPKGSRGIYLSNASNFVIGSGTGGAVDPGSVNVISGNNGAGLATSGASNIVIRGNYLGTNAAGTGEVYNAQNGLWLDSIESSTIADNVVSGNSHSAVLVRPLSSNLVFERNIMGANAMGNAPIPNQAGAMLFTDNPNASPWGISDVAITDNLVAYNTCGDCSAGIVIGVSNPLNLITGVVLSRNRVFGNQGLDIDLVLPNPTPWGLVYGVTGNDVGDPDTGANMLQNFPVINSAVADGVDAMIDYSFNSEASNSFSLEFFYTDTCDSSGHGDAQAYLGETTVNTNGSGNVSGQIEVTLDKTAGYITATATHAVNGTSEFSACTALSYQTGLLFEDGFEDPSP